ncbi:UrcA family protein [Sphingobium aromaticiconvertens]|uniref:UrcA family protein n=1 Tax=Sphingobium aromaticiconvertens TaxID=365341 RepID=UPI00301A8B8F
MFATKTLIALTALASLAAAGSANAGEFESNGRTAAVRYHDINLSDAAGQKELQRRIRSASNRVCVSADTRTMAACRKLALDHVKAPVASAIARAATGERYADAQTRVGK